jgi:hypothetical protein
MLTPHNDNNSTGFLFAFKTYVPQHDPCNAQLDCIENLVHHLTHSDLIHVEIIPVWGADADRLLVSHIAHTAYIGRGYTAHHAQTCLDDTSYQHVFVPVPDPQRHAEGVQFLHAMQGRCYNYLALPLTVLLPESCKFRAIHPARGHIFDTSKIFCSQMGLILCYLAEILRPEYHYHGQSIIFDPLCCTPADLYKLLAHGAQHGAAHYPAHCIHVLDTEPPPQNNDGGRTPPLDMAAIYDHVAHEQLLSVH